MKKLNYPTLEMVIMAVKVTLLAMQSRGEIDYCVQVWIKNNLEKITDDIKS